MASTRMPVEAATRTPPAAELDLGAYLRRIAYGGPHSPSLTLLNAVVLAQVTSIPYENIDVLLRRPVRMDLGTLQRKLVLAKRGGYCFETNTLLEAALHSLGFSVTCLGSHIVRGMPNGARSPARHKLLRIDLPEGGYIVDIGMGNLTPTIPIALQVETVQPTPHGAYRLLWNGDEFTLEAQLDEHWEQLFHFSLDPKLQSS